MKKIHLLAASIAVAFAGAAHADITIGVSISLTGPTSALGIPTKNGIELWPKSIAGEKLNVIVLDDATDPTLAVKNTRRFITEDHVDVIVGSVATPVAAAMADVAAEGQTVQLMLSPVNLPEGKGGWSFRMPQSTAVMAIPIVDYWKRTGVKTYGFLGYADAYGEAWLKDIQAAADKAGIKLIATERFARSDTSVTGQALKLVTANPDAILVAASGSGAAMPHKGLVERGYAKTKIFQTHGAASRDLIRIGGADVEGSFVSSGPAVVPYLLPDSNASKAIATKYVADYEKAFGKGNANQFAAHAYDVVVVLEKAVPLALKKAKPGTKEFRAALKDALETMGRTPVSQGVLNYTAADHFGYTPETGVLLTIGGGEWKLAPTK
ncbi:ABC transporter substrate-binding protein [Rhizobacter sp. Root404]|jgi:branched-chain amino acid transport system substrate-binding protein|uniref:ABC transporter substrate-binding protein n=1 Tax=Rhizobacter sp. Root404 TaxID=1736528 RepID=UPI0006F5A2C6|nr:ABC transporter substrate-binding protein [Rhizobacter sp. Root404]KQW38794.1 branched-chain amino acid ABC transporter substrate-binding protein [Rhizobacter sp. Root404]